MGAGSDLSIEESRAKMIQQFATFSGARYVDGWADLWEKGDFLPWDRLVPSPALIDTLINGRDLLGSPFLEDGGQRRRKRALVPGCGRGVDVLLLQSFGYDVVGLEVSPKAVDACEQFAREKEHEYPARNAEHGKGQRTYVLGDFFKDDWLEKAAMSATSKFELIYDYTFSHLICLEFPTMKPPATGGPPFSSPPKAYMEHLSHPGEPIKYSAEGEVMVNPLVAIGPGGLERVAHFHPPVAHAIGKDAHGNVADYISIWRHRY